MKKLRSYLSPLFIAPLTYIYMCVCGSNSQYNEVKEVSATETVTTDYSLFQKRWNGNGYIAPDSDKNSITYQGDWDGKFAVTDQFDTRANDYSLKIHVENNDWTIPTNTDTGTGFCIFYDDYNYISFYFKWDSSITDTFQDAAFYNFVGNKHECNTYQYALENNASNFNNSTTWVSLFSNNASNWINVSTNENIAPQGNTTILVNKGFDMTMNVKRSTYKNRLVDLIWFQVDAFASDRTTSFSIKTNTYAIDAMTNPCGNGETIYVDRKPMIGFQQYNTSATFSNIVFTNNSTETVNAKISRAGATMSEVGKVNQNGSISYKNNTENSGFLLTDLTTSSNKSFDLEAAVEGTDEVVDQAKLGFVYYFDETHYSVIYFKWASGTSTIAEMAFQFNVDGATTNVTNYAKSQWSESYSAQSSQWIECWTDYGGWTTDGTDPYANNNCNKIRDESAITIKSGFSFGIQRIRTTYNDREVDAFQMRTTAKGTDNLVHNWYSARYVIDAFTYPNGGEASSLKDANPTIGFYACGFNEISLSNVKFNGLSVNLSDSYKANDFAKQFMEETETICTTSTSKKSELSAKWSGFEENYSRLDADQKNILKISDASSSSTSIIERAMDRYDYIVKTYELTNFINRVNTNRINIKTSSDSESSWPIVLILIMAAGSITFIAYKKLKKNN